MINEQLLAEFERHRAELSRACAQLQLELTRSLDERGITVHFVSGRVKAPDSLRRKLSRPDKTYRRIWDVTDLVGLRIATYFEDAIDDVARLIEQTYRVDYTRSSDKLHYVDHGKFGYRSLHYICALPGPELVGTAFRFEIQVRTVLQHAWAEVEHDLGYKADDTVPDAIRRRFSRIASLLELADQEFVSIRNDLRQYQLAASDALSEPDRTLPLDVVSVVALAGSPEVAALDAELAAQLGKPLSTEPYSPEYLAKMLRLAGLSTTREVQDALGRHRAVIPRLIGPYFELTGRTWQLDATSIHAVGRGYGLFFLAHAAVLAGPDLGLSKVKTLTRMYLELDYPGDEEAAHRFASTVATVLQSALPRASSQ